MLLRRIVSLLLTVVAPGYGRCRRCRRPWRFVEEHTVWYSPKDGMFALCEMCWQRSDYFERLAAMKAHPGWPQLNDAEVTMALRALVR